MKFSSLKSVPDPSYALPRRRRRRRRRRIPRLGTRTGSTLLFSATTRFCDMKQERKYSFLTSRSIAKTRCTIRSSGVLLQTGRVFLMTFMVVVKSYMEVSNETSDTLQHVVCQNQTVFGSRRRLHSLLVSCPDPMHRSCLPETLAYTMFLSKRWNFIVTNHVSCLL